MKQKQLAWKTYWEQSHGDTFDQFYTEKHPLGLALNKLLLDLKIESKDVDKHLDLGCGKGKHIPWLRSNIPNIAESDLIGVDYAIENIDVDQRTSLIQDNFENLTNLRKKDLTFDSVSSIYSIEYGDFSKSLPSILSVLNKDAAFYVMLHSEKSIITHNSRITIEFYEKLLSTELFFMLDETSSLTTAKIEQYFLNTLKLIVSSNPNKFNYDIQLVAKKLQPLFNQNFVSEEKCLEQVTNYIQSLNHHAERLNQQIQASQKLDALVDNIDMLNGLIHKKTSVNSNYGELGVFMYVTF